MKKPVLINIKVITLVILFIIFVFFSYGLAAVGSYDFANSSGLNSTGVGAGYSQTAVSPEVIVGRIIQTILGFLGIAFLAFMIYAGIVWMTAQGNEQKVEKAKNMITESIVGLIIVVAAYAIAYFVISYFSTTVLMS